MTLVAALLAEARAAGVELVLRDGRLRLRGPCAPNLRQRLRAAREDLRAFLDGADSANASTCSPSDAAEAGSVGGVSIDSPSPAADTPPGSCGPYSRHEGPWRRRTDVPGPWVCQRCHPPGPRTEALGAWERRG